MAESSSPVGLPPAYRGTHQPKPLPFDPGAASGTFATLAKSHYGTVETWEHDFRLTGQSLGGGSGWVMATYDAFFRNVQWDPVNHRVAQATAARKALGA